MGAGMAAVMGDAMGAGMGVAMGVGMGDAKKVKVMGRGLRQSHFI